MPELKPLIHASLQGRRLTIVMTLIAVGAIATLFGGKLDSMTKAGVGNAVVGAGAVLFGTSILIGLRTIRCPRCNAGWLRYALGELPLGTNFFGWLFSFERCPKCGVTSEELKHGAV